mgnify:CR=1 FL=1
MSVRTGLRTWTAFLAIALLAACGGRDGSSEQGQRSVRAGGSKGESMSETGSRSVVTFEVHGMHCEGCDRVIKIKRG